MTIHIFPRTGPLCTRTSAEAVHHHAGRAVDAQTALALLFKSIGSVDGPGDTAAIAHVIKRIGEADAAGKSRCRCGTASPVLVQCGRGEASPGADVARASFSLGADVAGASPSPGADVAGASLVSVQM